MDFMVDGVYSAFKELMYYYYFEFRVFCFLVLIVLINVIKTIRDYICCRTQKSSEIISSYFDLIVSILAGIGLANGMFFQGVLSDISTEYSQIWFGKMLALCVIVFILFVVQVVFMSLNLRKR